MGADCKGVGDRAFGRNEVATVVMQVLLVVGGFDVDGGAELTLGEVKSLRVARFVFSYRGELSPWGKCG